MISRAAAVNVALCEALGIEHKGRANLHVVIEISVRDYPRVTVTETAIAGFPGLKGREIERRFALVAMDQAEEILAAPRFPRGSVRAAVALYRDHWRGYFVHKASGYALDGETVSRVQCRDLAVMQRASDREYHGTLWDARVWSGVPFGERVRAVNGL